MGMLQKLHKIGVEIDEQSVCDDGNHTRLPRALFMACLCLLGVHYLKFNYCFVALLDGPSVVGLGACVWLSTRTIVGYPFCS